MKSFMHLLPVVALVLLCAAPAPGLIDVNTASQSELESLPGIGEVYAKRIIEGRPYRSVNDLTRVKGIGRKTLDKFKDMVTAGTEQKKAPAPAMAAKQESAGVPTYSIESCKQFKCHNCPNAYKASSDLKSGWCPYCGARWRLQ